MLRSSRRKLTALPMAPPLGELAGASPTERERLWQAGRRKKSPFRRFELREGVFFLASQMTSLITTFIVFIRCAFSQKVKHCTESLQSLFSFPLLYLFGEKSGIMGLRPCPPIYSGGEVRKMESILSFILSVGANVAAYYICKWLDGWFMGRKH